MLRLWNWWKDLYCNAFTERKEADRDDDLDAALAKELLVAGKADPSMAMKARAQSEKNGVGMCGKLQPRSVYLCVNKWIGRAGLYVAGRSIQH